MKERETQENRKVHSLSGLTASIRRMFEEHFSERTFWVKAEMAKLNHYPRSGHCYPALVEKEGEKVLAEMRGTLWKDRYGRISREFEKVTGERFGDGIELLLQGRVRFHEVYGLSLDIVDVDPSYSLGEMERLKRETIEKLKKAGEFEQNKALSFPEVPKRLAVISVETSKGYQDLVKVLEKNAFKYVFEWELFPAILQGERAISTIREQLEAIRERKDAFDVLLIIRGGGGEVGLSCYDDHGLARDLALFPLPVITGIGHSTNETVSEMVAHLNAITPTAVGNALIQAYHNVAVPRKELEDRLEKALKDRFKEEERLLKDQSELFRSHTRQLFQEHRFRLRELLDGTVRAVPQRMKEEREQLGEQSNELRSRSSKRMEREKERLSLLNERIGSGTRYRLMHEKENVGHLEKQLRLLDPQRVLERGYSITLYKGRPVKDPEELKDGAEVETRVFKGRLKSRIEKGRNDER